MLFTSCKSVISAQIRSKSGCDALTIPNSLDFDADVRRAIVRQRRAASVTVSGPKLNSALRTGIYTLGTAVASTQ
eukprot:4733410-Pleurochrysis_carterae.AAC.1